MQVVVAQKKAREIMSTEVHQIEESEFILTAIKQMQGPGTKENANETRIVAPWQQWLKHQPRWSILPDFRDKTVKT